MNEQEVINYWKGRCFGCSTTNERGLKLRFWSSEQGCFTKCVIPDYLCGIGGLAHGGIVYLLMDEVCEWTIISRLGDLSHAGDDSSLFESNRGEC